MDSATESTVRQVFCDVLEGFAFMFVEPPDEEVPPPDGPLLAARMGFSGPRAGTVLLAVPEPLARELAANVLGVEPDDDAAMPGDALKELLNVVVGNLLTALAGDEPVFDLTIPELVQFAAGHWEALAGKPGSRVLLVDEQPVLLSVAMRAG
jgi:hypothetical protein